MKLESTRDGTTCAGLRYRLCMLATTCLSTFDVCPEYVPSVLASKADFSIAMQCAVIVHNNTPSSLSDDNSIYLARMLSRHRRLLHYLEPIFRQQLPSVRGQDVLLHSDAYDDALAQLRLCYRQDESTRWHVLPGSKSRWIFRGIKEAQEVFYDLLTGKLIIGGKQPGGLPQEIMEHPTYVSVFGTVSGEMHVSLAALDA